MSDADIEYNELVQRIFDEGERRDDRTGVGTWSIFGHQSRYDLRQGFPIITTKKVLFDAVVRELLWMLAGHTNINFGLTEHTSIWNSWADKNGELGPIYGHQWRSWGASYRGPGKIGWQSRKPHTKKPIDQIANVMAALKQRPTSRRLLVTAWNPAEIDDMALPPCHVLFQLYVAQGQWLDCQLYQRSADVALGLPFNVCSYALLTTMIAQECGLNPRYFIHTLGDAHVYANHVNALRSQINRDDRPAPRLRVAKRESIFDVEFGDIELIGYDPHPFIKYEVAV